MADEKESKKPIVKKKAPISKKKKAWFQIVAPEVFGRAVIGETLVEDAKQTMGKTIGLSLMSLTGDMKKQHITVTFAVDNVAEGKGQTKAVAYDIAPASIKRLVRRGRERVDASFICETKDGVKLAIKPFLLTAYETNRSTLTAIRKYAIAFIATYVSQNDYDTVFKDAVTGKLQAGVREAVRHVYPIRASEIRMMHITKPTAKVTALPHPSINVEQIMQGSQNRGARRPPVRSEAPQQSAEAAAQ